MLQGTAGMQQTARNLSQQTTTQSHPGGCCHSCCGEHASLCNNTTTHPNMTQTNQCLTACRRTSPAAAPAPVCARCACWQQGPPDHLHARGAPPHPHPPQQQAVRGAQSAWAGQQPTAHEHSGSRQQLGTKAMGRGCYMWASSPRQEWHYPPKKCR